MTAHAAWVRDRKHKIAAVWLGFWHSVVVTNESREMEVSSDIRLFL